MAKLKMTCFNLKIRTRQCTLENKGYAVASSGKDELMNCDFLLPFLENMFIKENPAVAIKAAMSPTMSKETSVRVAIATPPTMGMSDAYTFRL